MAYKILYIDDLETESRLSDIRNLGYVADLFNPTSDLTDLFGALETDTRACVLDYRLTKGINNACFDAPTIAQTLRTKHKNDLKDFPLILMSNETIKVQEFDKDLTSQDLFDFVLTKEEFSRDKQRFREKLDAFINSYETIVKYKFDLKKIIGFDDNYILHSRIKSDAAAISKNLYTLSSFIYYDIVRPIGIMIGEDVLSARLGVSKESGDWKKLLEIIDSSIYEGVFSEYLTRWWMDKIIKWWNDEISPGVSLRSLNAEERVELLKSKTGLKELVPLTKTKHSLSSSFWTICKHSGQPLDPFDGIELLKTYLPWKDKEYISIDSALEKMDDYKLLISKIDKKAIRDIVEKERTNG
ncbi:hypothetical protein OQ279_09470 [Salinimicrobium sp. MT39]|uniref:Uncharacterized protein n=1 Tax=Salinimicrobium profundisediminis TaxID=2994553 RepID=A0A9X3CWZ9_9FLAO|nr:hypothetical protein [Salinimicrobium profundisediminis]MCX2838381.1 hypothetical protein [Salinimicrobium profundisediminis]